MSILIASAIAFAGSTSVPTAANAQWWKTHDGCMVTEHRDGKGKRWIVNDGESWSYVGGKWNDKISSVICEVFCVLTAWEHRDYQGARRRFESTAYVGNAWNDRISSLSVRCDPD